MGEVRPAVAYYVMSRALPKRYFRNPPPECGFRCIITGVDGRETYWDLDSTDVRKVERAAARAGCQVQMSPFGPPEPSASPP
jgi:hypothetical protein